MAEYIKRESIQKALKNVTDDPSCPLFLAAMIEQYIDQEPAADVVEVKHGKWNGWHGDKLVGIDDNGDDMYRHYHYNTCSECGRGNAIKSAYCPHCGAKMGAEG